jgi:monoterpene epsilon-lactone hydrolase
MNTNTSLADSVDTVVMRIQATYARWDRQTTVAQMRTDWDSMFSASDQACITPADANGVPCQWVQAPSSRNDRTIVYFHGGGFQVGSLLSHRELMLGLSEASGMRVLGVDYRMTPEHRYPAPVEDGLTVMQWLQEQGVLGGSLAVAGDSAGGGLALAVLLAMQRHGHPRPAAGFVMSAWTDMTASGTSYETRSAVDPIHQRPMMLALARNYLGKTQDPTEPLASPMLAPPVALAGLPPLLLQVGERETLVSDSEDFAQRVCNAGGHAECQIWPRMIHVFQQYPADLPEAKQALAVAGEFLARHLGLNNTLVRNPT